MLSILNHLVKMLVMISICICIPVAAFSETVDDLQLMTEQYPPYNFIKNDKLQGIAVDCTVAVLKELKSTLGRKDIQMFPWARGYYNVQKKKNTCLFSTTRTKQREDMFKWVGPICAQRVVLIAPKKLQIKIESAADMMKYQIGTVRDDVGEQLLIQKGIEKDKLDIVSTPELNAKKLDKGRIQMWAYSDKVAKWVIKEGGFNPQDYEAVYVLSEADLYYAFHKETSDTIISEFQHALDEVTETGELQKIIDSYLK